LDPALDELSRPEAFGRRQLLQEREAARIDTDGHAALVGSGPRRIPTAGPWGIRRPPLARREVSRCLIAEASAGRAAAWRATAMRTEVAVATTATSATGTPLAAVSASFVGHPRTLPATSGIGQREPQIGRGVRSQRLTDGHAHGTVLSAYVVLIHLGQLLVTASGHARGRAAGRCPPGPCAEPLESAFGEPIATPERGACRPALRCRCARRRIRRRRGTHRNQCAHLPRTNPGRRHDAARRGARQEHDAL